MLTALGFSIWMAAAPQAASGVTVSNAASSRPTAAATALHDDDSLARVDSAEVYYLWGDYGAVVRLLQRPVAVRPREQLLLGWSLYRLGRMRDGVGKTRELEENGAVPLRRRDTHVLDFERSHGDVGNPRRGHGVLDGALRRTTRSHTQEGNTDPDCGSAAGREPGNRHLTRLYDGGRKDGLAVH